MIVNMLDLLPAKKVPTKPDQFAQNNNERKIMISLSPMILAMLACADQASRDFYNFENTGKSSDLIKYSRNKVWNHFRLSDIKLNYLHHYLTIKPCLRQCTIVEIADGKIMSLVKRLLLNTDKCLHDLLFKVNRI
jgi:hypothetical protein